jgi:hypothetical protein
MVLERPRRRIQSDAVAPARNGRLCRPGVATAATLAAPPLPVSVNAGAGTVPVILFALLYRFRALISGNTELGGGLAGDEGSGKSTPEAHTTRRVRARSIPTSGPLTSRASGIR